MGRLQKRVANKSNIMSSQINNEGIETPQSATRNPHSLSSVIIAGGGTGGHIYPGIAIAQEFKRRNANCKIIFVGTARGLENKIVPREGFVLELIAVAALKGVSIDKRTKSLLMLPKSFLAVRSLIKKHQPEVVIGVGGYASGPMVLIASLMGVPTLIAEQNALPGFTNRMLSRFVKAAAVSFAEAKSFFGNKAEITGNPVRAEFFTIAPRPNNETKNIVITGGSQGARAINNAMVEALPLLEAQNISIVHQTGELDFERIKAAYAQSPIKAEVKPFIEKIVDEFANADLVISRAGATTVAELAAAGRPALMIPFPLAADDHQRKNAEAVERAGAGRMILQSELTGERLAKELLALINEPEKLAAMSAASKKLAHPDAAAKVVNIAERIK